MTPVRRRRMKTGKLLCVLLIAGCSSPALPPGSDSGGRGLQVQPGSTAERPFVGPGCPNWVHVYEVAGFPAAARSAGLTEGEVQVEFTLEPTGRLREPRIVNSTDVVFNAPTLATAEQIVCIGGERDIRVRFSVNYKLR